MNTAKARARHDLTCPPSCPHFRGLFEVSFPRDTWFDRLEREVEARVDHRGAAVLRVEEA